MAKEGELSLWAYKHEVYASWLQIAKYQNIFEDKDVLLVENEAKILKFQGDLHDKSEMLRKMNYFFEHG